MSDFYQSGCITTIHDLNTLRTEDLELMIKESGHRSALLLPVTASDMRSESFEHIVNELAQTDYLTRIVVSLGVAPHRDDYLETIERLRPIRTQVDVLWADSPGMLSFFDSLDDEFPAASLAGKGRSVWAAVGYILSAKDVDSIVLHDCDIVTYDRFMAARLIAPVSYHDSGFDFVKAYYARYTTKMHGRVVRLLVTPLIQALSQLTQHADLLQFLSSFRYPLAGEFGMSSELAWNLPIAADWGLEITSLSKVFQLSSPNRVCQVDLATRYDHKHQEMSADDSARGLNRMASDIITATRNALNECEVAIPDEDQLVTRFLQEGQQLIEKYAADATLNGLSYDSQSESSAMELFSKRISEIWSQQSVDSCANDAILPSWQHLCDRDPGILQRLAAMVDNSS